jgi:hypothetical protein
MLVQGLSALKFPLPNGLQKSNDPTAFIGSQYISHAVEANLPLSIDPTIWLIALLATVVICGILGLWLAGQRLQGIPWGKIHS